jgi:ferredoxin
MTDNDKCIACMRCISLCPNQARYLAPEIIEVFTEKLSAVATERKQNSLYL